MPLFIVDHGTSSVFFSCTKEKIFGTWRLLGIKDDFKKEGPITKLILKMRFFCLFNNNSTFVYL